MTKRGQPTRADLLEKFLRERPHQWIDGQALASCGAGRYAWRTRVSDLRRRGMVINNRQRHVKLPSGGTITVSEYCFVPDVNTPALETSKA